MLKLATYVLYDVLRNKILLIYTILLLFISVGLFQMEENNNKAMLGVLSIILIVIPLVSLVFTTIHFYNSYEFMELLLTQPQSRSKVFYSEFLGVSIALLVAFIIGIGIPVLLYTFSVLSVYLLLSGVVLSLIFCSIGFLISTISRDKAKGIGIALMVWFYFALIYDGVLMIVLFLFSDYPTEKLTFLFSALNPIDLSRVFVMLKMDIGALMGYTGAIYKAFLGKNTGILFSITLNAIWIVLPLWMALRTFKQKDF